MVVTTREIPVVEFVSAMVVSVVPADDLQEDASEIDAMAAPVAATPALFKNCRLENLATRNNSWSGLPLSFITISSPHVLTVLYCVYYPLSTAFYVKILI
jgi:hypothetical protein